MFTINIPWFDLKKVIKFNFFAPIFNIADVAISFGVGIIIVFQRSVFQAEFFPKKPEVKEESEADSKVSENID